MSRELIICRNIDNFYRRLPKANPAIMVLTRLQIGFRPENSPHRKLKSSFCDLKLIMYQERNLYDMVPE